MTEKQILPQSVPLDMRLVYKRNMGGYEEWLIEYTAEGADTWPERAGRKVPAYVLVPEGRSKPPYPAMLCNHQCNVDCHLGKEVVVGKVVDRPDQAFGLELVRQGFVVLAPDGLFCGQRNIPEMRKEGEAKPCFDDVKRFLHRDWEQKLRDDGIRAVDLLASLDFVDKQRIGVIGHSGGSFGALVTMAADKRIKAGIISGRTRDWDAKRFSPIAPRLLIILNGLLDGATEDIERTSTGVTEVMSEYREAGAEDNLILRTHKCGHHFIDEFKWFAYRRLKEHFGMQPVRKLTDLSHLLRNARQLASWAWNNDDSRFLPIPEHGGKVQVLVDENMESALFRIFVHLTEKTPADSSLSLEIDVNGDSAHVACSIPAGDDSVKVAHDYDDIRYCQQVFSENHATWAREQSNTGLRYVLGFKCAEQERIEDNQQKDGGDA